MSWFARAGRAFGRGLATGARLLTRACKLALILVLVALPNPLVVVLSALLTRERRNLPAEVLRKKP
ncbi:hypothetical protein DRW03_33930 [Corallococcus sp. H22C18031201]|uniref:hypothetical protein n=1 Tax=Citreicoccus inhibens TaxID=2849499 RepID=UPI000E734C2D|nr:hypothetical protein [Citreicoccus inhibens]MBU8899170.1 hypothetical protein [Citreicoccus inhibens]RJS15242.1 hypothetical protein DRW03_33930 [Corallococcus sp. H22C18031201]